MSSRNWLLVACAVIAAATALGLYLIHGRNEGEDRYRLTIAYTDPSDKALLINKPGGSINYDEWPRKPSNPRFLSPQEVDLAKAYIPHNRQWIRLDGLESNRTFLFAPSIGKAAYLCWVPSTQFHSTIEVREKSDNPTIIWIRILSSIPDTSITISKRAIIFEGNVDVQTIYSDYFVYR